MSRQSIRQTVRKQRQSLDPQLARAHAYSLTQQVADWAPYRRARNIGIYLTNDGELDTAPLIEMMLRHHKNCFLPVLHGRLFNRLAFARWQPGDPLSENRYRIPEPDLRAMQLDRVYALDLVFMPLVAFDGALNRLGMGGGYYDRTFEFLRYRKVWKKPQLVGLAYDFQQVDSLPVESWDVPLTAVITNQDIIV